MRGVRYKRTVIFNYNLHGPAAKNSIENGFRWVELRVWQATERQLSLQETLIIRVEGEHMSLRFQLVGENSTVYILVLQYFSPASGTCACPGA